MISLTRLSGSQFMLNGDLLERIDETPDTVITLADGTKYVVCETMEQVAAKIRWNRAEIIALSEQCHLVEPVPPAAHGGPVGAKHDVVSHLVVVGDGASEEVER